MNKPPPSPEDASRSFKGEGLLGSLIASIELSPDIAGALLMGSRACGTSNAASDYDVVLVLRDSIYDARKSSGFADIRRSLPPNDQLDVYVVSAGWLASLLRQRSPFHPGYARARVLVDKSSELSSVVDSLKVLAAEWARALAQESYVAYMNSFVRSLRAWVRGDELGRVRKAVRQLPS